MGLRSQILRNSNEIILKLAESRWTFKVEVFFKLANVILVPLLFVQKSNNFFVEKSLGVQKGSNHPKHDWLGIYFLLSHCLCYPKRCHVELRGMVFNIQQIMVYHLKGIYWVALVKQLVEFFCYLHNQRVLLSRFSISIFVSIQFSELVFNSINLLPKMVKRSFFWDFGFLYWLLWNFRFLFRLLLCRA